jgi:hypothetical protein
MDNNPNTQLTPDDSSENNQDNAAQAQSAEAVTPVGNTTVIKPAQGNNQNPQSYSSNDFANETSKPKRNRLLIILIACIVILLIACGVGYIHHRSVSTKNYAAGITVANERIPLSSCTTAHSLIKQPLNGDECYIAKFNVGTETIHYVIIEQSAAYQQKQANECSLDCGGNIAITSSDYVVRANGKVQSADPTWALNAETFMYYLTGCEDESGVQFGVLNDSSSADTQRFVQDGGDIGIYVSDQNVVFPQNFGNSCTISFSLTHDIVGSLAAIKATDDLRISQLKVHYSLQPLSSCQQQSSTNITQCYLDQASMTNKLSLCPMTVASNDLSDDDEECISNLAARREDPTLCETIQITGMFSQSIQNSDIKNCQQTAEEDQQILQHKLIDD